MNRSAAQVRRDFIDYFVKKAGHTFVPSSPVVPHDDPTLLFTNAGMNQFKDVFLGTGTRRYQRAVNSQKCIRAGGKHNDLEDVGKDTYHHTFFEMLGNWSFGDYFKAEAIEWAWDLLTNIWSLPKDRLHATYFQGDPAENLDPDHEARDLWRRYLPDSQIHPGNKKDNFWEMGESGPCGPCSEIHFDQTPKKNGAKLVNASDPRVIEIWNLVFIQFNRAPGTGKLSLLPAKHVDTGMGFERITRILQGKDSNYDTDVWMPIFAAIEQQTGARPYRGKLEDHTDIAYRVIADHIRCLTMAITDGARPSNEGRGYVLRRILRRAVRHAHQTLNVKGPLLHRLVSSVVQSLGGGDAFPELTKDPHRVAEIIREEEEAFLKTLDRGLELFHEAAGRATSKTIAAEDAFKLHDTYGFPIDLTRVMAEERGLTVDIEGFERMMEQAREVSRAKSTEGASDGPDLALPPDAIERLKRIGVRPTEDIDKYHARPIRAKVEAIWNGTDFDDQTDESHKSMRFAIITDKSNFYAEAGGQVGDTGRIVDVDGDRSEFIVEHTRTIGSGANAFVMHIGRLLRGEINVGETVQMMIPGERRNAIRANHTATHLLNWALRDVLGDEIHQRGSLVADDRLRFDYSSGRAMRPEEIDRVETLVNEAVMKKLQVHAEIVPLEQARRIRGLRAVFGEKYPDPVRVVSIGMPVKDLLAEPGNARWMAYSVEFCGGTHLNATDEAKRFVVVSEQALAAGVRRITALTGAAAMAADIAGKELEDRARNAVNLADDLLLSEFDEVVRYYDELTLSMARKHRINQQIESLRSRVKSIRKSAQSSARGSIVDQARDLVEKSNGNIIVEQLLGADKDSLLAAMDVVKAKRPDAAAMLISANELESKVFIVAAVPKTFIDLGLKAGDWVKQAAAACGGSGGGRPDMAQAGGKDPQKLPDAMNAALSFARQKLGAH
jgi:alanyl-tRNA synthetase